MNALVINATSVFDGMRNLTVALVQLDPVDVPGEFSSDSIEWTREYARRNFPKVVESLKKLDVTKVDLVVLPENIPGGISTASALSPEISLLLTWSSNSGVYVMASEEHHLKDGRYNTLVFISPDGKIQRYSKRNLYLTEVGVYLPGTGPRLFEVRGVRVYPLICNDVMKSGFMEEAKAMGAELVIYQSAAVACEVNQETRASKKPEQFDEKGWAYFEQHARFGKGRRFTWQARLVQDANEYGLPILFCNLSGEHWPEPNPLGGGYSMVILPKRGVVSRLDDKEGVLTYRLEL